MFTRSGGRRSYETSSGDASGHGPDAPWTWSRRPACAEEAAHRIGIHVEFARLQQNLQAFERHLREHKMEVQQRMAAILATLDCARAAQATCCQRGVST